MCSKTGSITLYSKDRRAILCDQRQLSNMACSYSGSMKMQSRTKEQYSVITGGTAILYNWRRVNRLCREGGTY